jgi:hypothetical protein
MGAAHTTGVRGTIIVGKVSGEQLAGAGALIVDRLGSTREPDLVDEHIDGPGLLKK